MATTTITQSCSVTPVATDADFEQHISSLPPSSLAVIYFHAPWAEPCKQMSTILDTLSSTYEATNPARISFLSLDAEELADVSERYDVTQVPLVVLQKGGQVVDAITGTDASKVRSAVEKHGGRPGVASTNGTSAGGATTLPPAQKVTKPAPTAAVTATAPHEAQSNGNGNGNNLAKYAPSANDPQTAPQFSSGETTAAATQEELNKRLGELVKAAPVMLFMKGTPSTPQCGFSRQTVSILRENGVRYGFFNILADDEVRQGLKEFSDWPTFPQLYVDGELVGGLDIIKEEFANDNDFLKQYSVHA